MNDWQNSEDILINIAPHETRIALIQKGSVQEIWLERHQHRRSVGNLYWARVDRLMNGMQAAFLKIDATQSAFLHASDVAEYLNPERLPLQKVLFEGQFILVQISKDATQNKHARATTHITLSGRNLVYVPFSKKIGISHKIKEQQVREQMREKLQELQQNKDGGYIMRTVAHKATHEELDLDVQFLEHTWQLIKQNMQHKTSPCLVYQDLPLSFKACRDLVNPQTKTIYVDDENSFHELQAFTKKYIPYAYQALKFYPSHGQNLFALYQVDKELQELLQQRVNLKSGAYLLFDQTQALTTIDVNTGSFSGYKNFEESIYQTNLEAAKMIMRQLRLRNISGMIIIDFIDMKSAEHQQNVLNAMHKMANLDRTKIHIYGFTQLGLVEMTRKRSHESMRSVLSQTCHYCEGTGVLKSPQSLCYEILHQIVTQAQQFQPKAFKVIAHDHVINHFLQQESHVLRAVEDSIGRRIELQAQSFTNPNGYHIVLQ